MLSWVGDPESCQGSKDNSQLRLDLVSEGETMTNAVEFSHDIY